MQMGYPGGCGQLRDLCRFGEQGGDRGVVSPGKQGGIRCVDRRRGRFAGFGKIGYRRAQIGQPGMAGLVWGRK